MMNRAAGTVRSSGVFRKPNTDPRRLGLVTERADDDATCCRWSTPSGQCMLMPAFASQQTRFAIGLRDHGTTCRRRKTTKSLRVWQCIALLLLVSGCGDKTDSAHDTHDDRWAPAAVPLWRSAVGTDDERHDLRARRVDGADAVCHPVSLCSLRREARHDRYKGPSTRISPLKVHRI